MTSSLISLDNCRTLPTFVDNNINTNEYSVSLSNMQTNSDEFDKWIVDDFVPNTPENSTLYQHAKILATTLDLNVVNTTQKQVSNKLSRAILKNNISMISEIITENSEEFKAELITKDSKGLTPIFWIIIHQKNVFEYLTLIAEAAPEEFRSNICMQENLGYTFLSVLVEEQDIRSVKFVAKFAQSEFKKTVSLRNDDGNTLVATAVMKNNMQMLKLLFKHASEEFKNALTLTNNSFSTPITLAYQNTELLKFMHRIDPRIFQEASTMRDEYGFSILDYIKETRPQNYHDISKLFRKNSEVKLINKEICNRVALSHFFDIAGNTNLIAVKSDDPYATIDLEGWSSPQWFNLMEKDLHRFKEIYPYSLKKNEIDLLLKTCRLQADRNFFTMQQQFEAIKSRMGFLSIGFINHEVTLAISEDLLGICNRGDGSRGAMEFFHFNPRKLNFEVFKQLLDLRLDTKENFEKILYHELSAKLKFKKTTLTNVLEKNNHLFPLQCVGNCSLVSPITAIYAFRLLLEVKGMTTIPKDMDNRLWNVIDWYHTWLNFQRLAVLERNIQPIDVKERHFKPDHELISECLCRAHMLHLDDISREKLRFLTETYLKLLNIKERVTFRKKLTGYFPTEGRALF